MKKPGGPPSIDIQDGGPVENISNLISSMSCVVARSICEYTSDSHARDTERHIKIILNLLVEVDPFLRGKNDSMIWIST